MYKYVASILLLLALIPLFAQGSEDENKVADNVLLLQATRKLDELLGKYTERHPDVIALKREIGFIKTKLSVHVEKDHVYDVAEKIQEKVEYKKKEGHAALRQEKVFQVEFNIKSNIRYQTMHGFGSTVRLFDDPHLTNSWNPSTKRASALMPREEEINLLMLIYKDLGLTRIRPATGMGVEVVNDNDTPDETDLSKFNFEWKNGDGYIKYIKRVIPMGAKTHFLSPIFIEPWMSESNPEEYVEWAFNIINHWANEGLEPPYYSIINEPSYRRGGVWSKEFILKVVVRLGRRLENHGLKTKLVIPDDLNPKTAYKISRYVLANAEARKYVGAIAYHLYGDHDVEPLQLLSEKYNIPLWMTEYKETSKGRASPVRRALIWANTMHRQITEYGASAVDYMWAFFGNWSERKFPGDSLVSILFEGDEYKGYRRNPSYYAMKHYSRYVRPGFSRISASSQDTRLKVSAFENDGKLVFVIINERYKAVRGSFLFEGVRFQSGLKAVQSSEVGFWRGIPITINGDRNFFVNLAPNSITTVYSDLE